MKLSNADILEKAINLAIAGGWNGEPYNDDPRHIPTSKSMQRAIIFNHDFAKALWGEATGIKGETIPSWKYFLMQMVIADDPIKYLGEHLDNEPKTGEGK